MASQLPPKYETVLCIRLSEIQRTLYQTYIKAMEQTEGSNLLKAHSHLLCVWNHPDLLLTKAPPAAASASASAGLRIDEEPSQQAGAACAPTAAEVERPRAYPASSDAHGTAAVAAAGGPSTPAAADASSSLPAERSPWWEPCGEWWKARDPLSVLSRSGKLTVALEILKEASLLEEKTLMFSQSLDMLNLTEKVCFPRRMPPFAPVTGKAGGCGAVDTREKGWRCKASTATDARRLSRHFHFVFLFAYSSFHPEAAVCVHRVV